MTGASGLQLVKLWIHQLTTWRKVSASSAGGWQTIGCLAYEVKFNSRSDRSSQPWITSFPFYYAVHYHHSYFVKERNQTWSISKEPSKEVIMKTEIQNPEVDVTMILGRVAERTRIVLLLRAYGGIGLPTPSPRGNWSWMGADGPLPSMTLPGAFFPPSLAEIHAVPRGHTWRSDGRSLAAGLAGRRSFGLARSMLGLLPTCLAMSSEFGVRGMPVSNGHTTSGLETATLLHSVRALGPLR